MTWCLMRRPLRHHVAVAFALSFVGIGCTDPTIDTSWHQESGYRWRALQVPRNGRAGFAMLTSSSTGLTHVNTIDIEHGLANRGLLDGAGVALGDVDGDGLPDVVLASEEKPAALYHNDGAFHFTDVTARSGLDFTGLQTTSVVLVDVDGDRDLDLIVGTFGGPVKLYLNDGKGHFTDATASSGLTGIMLTLASGTAFVMTRGEPQTVQFYNPALRTFSAGPASLLSAFDALPWRGRAGPRRPPAHPATLGSAGRSWRRTAASRSRRGSPGRFVGDPRGASHHPADLRGHAQL